MPVKISVIVPVYNAAETIEQCAESILCQTLGELELILVDDGSADESGTICDRIAESDSRVSVIHTSNGGPGAARNAGIQRASGEFIGFADADDTAERDMYQSLYLAACESSADLAFCDYRVIYGADMRELKSADGGFYSREQIKEKILPYFFGYTPEELGAYKTCCPFADYRSYVWLGIYRASVIRNFEIEFPSQRKYYNEDNLFNLLFLLNANSAVHVPLPLYSYVENSSSLTKGYDKNYFGAKLNKFGFLRSVISERGLDGNFQQRLDNKICIECINCINYYVRAKELSIPQKISWARHILTHPDVALPYAQLDISHLGLSPLKLYLFFAKKKAACAAFFFSSVHSLLQRAK